MTDKHGGLAGKGPVKAYRAKAAMINAKDANGDGGNRGAASNAVPDAHRRERDLGSDALLQIVEIEELLNSVALKGHQKYYCCNENCLINGDKKKLDKEKQPAGAGQGMLSTLNVNQGTPAADRVGAGVSPSNLLQKAEAPKDE